MARKSLLQLRGILFLEKNHIITNFHLTQKVKPVRSFHHVCTNHSKRLLTRTSHRQRLLYTSSTLADTEITVRYSNGLPQFMVTLPSRREQCQFTMRPISNNVGDLLQCIQDEDHGVDRVAVYDKEGTRIAKSTPIDILLQSNFEIVINDLRYAVNPPEPASALSEHSHQLDDVRNSIAQLYSTLNVEQYQLEREKELQTRLENLKQSIEPYESIRGEVEKKAQRRLTIAPWVGLGLMSVQFGVLARLTWWEYSWDIMEPVTYFVTYGTSMAMFGYFVLCKQEYNFADAHNREYLMTLHRHFDKNKFDLDEYNRLKDAINQAETDLRRLRDPLQLQLPLPQLPPNKYHHPPLV